MLHKLGKLRFDFKVEKTVVLVKLLNAARGDEQGEWAFSYQILIDVRPSTFDEKVIS